MAFDLIIFDLDGVLVDSEVLSCGALRDALAEAGLSMPFDEVVDRFLGSSYPTVEDYFLARTGVYLAEDFRDRLKDRLFAAFRRELQPMTGAAALLSRTRCGFCLASSSDADRIALSLATTGLDRHFGPRVFNRAMVPRGKPAPDLFLHAATAMRVAPERTLVIEDSVNGVLAGKAAGMTVWGFVGGSHYRSRDAASLLRHAGADAIHADLDAILPAVTGGSVLEPGQ